MDRSPDESITLKNDALKNILDFTEQFNEKKDNCAKASDLQAFIVSFLPKLKGNTCELHELFSKLISKIPELFDQLLNFHSVPDCSNAYENKISEKHSKLQASFLYLEIISMLLNTKSEEQRLLFLQISITVLYKGYYHCQECENIYGELLEEFKDQLANFFNKIQDVQNVMLLEFDELLKKKLHANRFHLIASLSDSMYRLCELVFNLDPTSSAGLYKRLVELFDKYKEIGRVQLNIDFILTALISEISTLGSEFRGIIRSKEQVPVSDFKIFLFKINLVRKIVDLFPSCIKENLQCVTNLALGVYELLISFYYHAAEDTSKNALVNIIRPMLSLFNSEGAFLTHVLLFNSKEISCDFQMAHLLLKLSAIDYLHCKKDLDNIPDEKESFKNVFLLLQENSSEDDMKLVSMKISLSLYSQGKRLQALHQPRDTSEVESATIFQLAFINLAEYSRQISDSDFEKLESSVIDFLLSNSCNMASLLISDVWMYRLRCSSVENLFARCITFSEKLLTSQINSSAKLLLKRMIKYLPSDYEDRLFRQNDQLKPIICEQTGLLRFGAPQHCINPQMKENDIKQKISVLLDKLKETDFNETQQLILKACNILELCAISIDVLDIQEFLRFAEFATLMLKSEIYEIQIAVLSFLRALNFKKFNDKDPLFSKVRLSIATLFDAVLRSKNYIVRLEAFSIFYNMAKLTYIKIAQEIIFQFPDLYPDIKAYVSNVPQSGFLVEKDKIEILKEQLCSFENKTESNVTLSDHSQIILSSLLPT